MRIVHVINALTVGGAELMLLSAAQELRKRGHLVTVISLGPGDVLGEERWARAGLRVIRLRSRTYLSLVEFLRQLQQEKYDICHSHLFPAMLYGAVARRTGLVPRLVHTEHATTNNRRRWWFRIPESVLLGSADAIVAISGGVQAALARWMPSVSEKIEVVFNPVETALRKKNYQVGPIQRLICVGRLAKEKSIPTQLEALRNVKGVTIDYFGDGPMRFQLIELARDLGVSDKVRFLGPVDDVLSRYGDYDALVHSANNEGFGLAVGEAMSAGLPVIVARVSGVTEVAGPDALYFEADNAQSLAASLQQFALMKEDARAALGRKLSERVRMFSLGEHADRLEALYRRLLSSQGHQASRSGVA